MLEDLLYTYQIEMFLKSHVICKLSLLSLPEFPVFGINLFNPPQD